MGGFEFKQTVSSRFEGVNSVRSSVRKSHVGTSYSCSRVVISGVTGSQSEQHLCPADLACDNPGEELDQDQLHSKYREHHGDSRGRERKRCIHFGVFDFMSADPLSLTTNMFGTLGGRIHLFSKRPQHLTFRVAFSLSLFRRCISLLPTVFCTPLPPQSFMYNVTTFRQINLTDPCRIPTAALQKQPANR